MDRSQRSQRNLKDQPTSARWEGSWSLDHLWRSFMLYVTPAKTAKRKPPFNQRGHQGRPTLTARTPDSPRARMESICLRAPSFYSVKENRQCCRNFRQQLKAGEWDLDWEVMMWKHRATLCFYGSVNMASLFWDLFVNVIQPQSTSRPQGGKHMDQTQSLNYPLTWN